jgi:hypothetical protein
MVKNSIRLFVQRVASPSGLSLNCKNIMEAKLNRVANQTALLLLKNRKLKTGKNKNQFMI